MSFRRVFSAVICTTAVSHTLAAQDGYKQPPAPIAQILDVEPTAAVSVSPNRSMLLLMERYSLPPISEVSAPEVRLAGQRINPGTNAGARDVTYKGLRLRAVDGNAAERRIETPPGARLSNIVWSSDGGRIAFTVGGDSSLALWMADVATGKSRQPTRLPMNGAMGAPCKWLGTSQMVCRTVVGRRGPRPSAISIPAGPVVQQSLGRTAATRTYQDLLQNPADEAMFDYYLTSQVALIGVDGTVNPIGGPAVYRGADPSPDGRYLLVTTVRRPYSYVLPVWGFAQRVEVWNLSGAVVKTVADIPVLDDIGTSFDAVPVGPRDVTWRADAPAALVWAQALDDGKPSKPAAKRDRLHLLAAPFSGEPVAMLDMETRFSGIAWVRSDLALVDEDWNKTRRTRTWAIDPSRPGAAARLVFDRLSEDRYADPGNFVTTIGSLGTRVVLTTADKRWAYLTGAGASPKGDMPFLDRIDLATGKTERLWRSAEPHYEEVISILDPAATRVLTRRESVNDVPNYFLRDVRNNRVAQLTRFTDSAPQFASVQPQLITYKRGDGVQLSAKLYLPIGHTSARGRLPFLFWAYPQEFKTTTAAAQVVGSPYRFVRPAGSSHLFLVTQGYGVLDGPTMPIVGEGSKEPNDSYVEQLVASAKAAIDKVVEMGVADRQRIAIGGHSYGAFMTANLLAHSNLFRAGIARSGAYNRTLTPFGFQAEERTFWEARDTYAAMSPFYFANQINEPILLIHGGADDNSGTFPIQSERMYAALKGNGATVRYVVLPAEPHGYRARESVGHTLWEMVTWLDSYVKSAKPVVSRPPAG